MGRGNVAGKGRKWIETRVVRVETRLIASLLNQSNRIDHLPEKQRTINKQLGILYRNTFNKCLCVNSNFEK